MVDNSKIKQLELQHSTSEFAKKSHSHQLVPGHQVDDTQTSVS
jgi:hypothetical protein